ncbi:hypothetical protein BH10PSE12_BH10PSE12_14130 [soil metagenome]
MSTPDEDRKRRLAQSLRDNLRRRKGQARETGTPASGEAAENGDGKNLSGETAGE